jgi:myosin regulatory light chain 12
VIHPNPFAQRTHVHTYTHTHHRAGTDPEEVIRNAFKCFDSDNTGVMGEEQLKEILTTMGDKKMSPEEVDLMLETAPYDKDGNFDYLQFTKTLKHGTVVKT